MIRMISGFIALAMLAGMAANAQQLEMVKDCNTAGNSYPNNLTVAGNKLFFLAADNSGYQKLWVTQGSGATTVLLLNQILMQTQKLVAYNGKVYFDCYTATYGQELWESDGTVAGTHIFADLYPGSSGSYPSAFTVTNNKLFFIANNPAGENRLYSSDGTVAGTIVLKAFAQLFNGLSDFAVLNNEIYFTSDGGMSIYVYGMWKSDGTLAGTAMVKPGIASSIGGNAAVLNNKLYFTAADDAHGTELWVTNGTDPGTYMVKNLAPDGGGILSSGAPQHITVYNSQLYFFASDPLHGQEFYTSDGTDPGTVLVKDILPGTGSSVCNEIIIYNGLMYFTSYQLQEMWKSDGTTAGTQLVKANMNDRLYYSPVYNNKMSISGYNDPVVWQSDGTTAGTSNMTATNTSNPIQFYSADLHMTEYNGALYFSGFCGGITTGYELCKFSANAPVSYSFTGNGNWSNPVNWAGGIVPPATLPAGTSVVINGSCILDITQHIATGATLIVAAGKSLVINGSLTLN
ncbi:MAG: hypothetical protein ABIX01_23505 [Chitinophagaceae bacterium]